MALRSTLLLLFLLVLGGAGASDFRTEFQRLSGALEETRKAENWPKRREYLVEFDRLLGKPSFATLMLAGVEARLGNRDASVNLLKSFASAGLSQDPSAIPAFASLKGNAAFDQVRRDILRNATPVHLARTAAEFKTDRDIVAEDLAYDERSRRFFVSSIRKRKILVITEDGAAKDFTQSRQDDADSILALEVDPVHPWLWASTASMPQEIGYAKREIGRSALLRYDLNSGKLLERYAFDCRAAQCVLGDMTISHSGEIFVSESVEGGVYRLRPGAKTFETLVAPGKLISPQQPTLVLNESVLLIPDYAAGVARLVLRTGELTWMEHGRDVAIDGIDGLNAWGKDLIAVQNGVEPNRVIRLSTDREYRRIEGWKPIESGTTELGAPDHGKVVNSTFYFVGCSGWELMEENGFPKKGSTFAAPSILAYELQ